MKHEVKSWGNYPVVEQRILPIDNRYADLPGTADSVLAHGNGRSYGDSCLNPQNTVLATRGLDRLISFDRGTGVFTCESGVTLAEIIDVALPSGWFLPVTPGTRFVTVGGAIANDVHGKNHHRAGTFGHHVRRLELLRSDGSRHSLGPGDATGLFGATIGGLGLTGVITSVEIQLRRVPGPWLDAESIRFDSLDAFFDLSSESASTHEYTVAWIDCLASGKRLGRGHFLRADHARGLSGQAAPATSGGVSMPFTPPLSLVNRLTLRPFNFLYYWRQKARRRRVYAHYQSYFYPLDGIKSWNRMYGPRGFLQHQCVLPPDSARDGVTALLKEISRARQGSFLAVLKEFGDTPSIGMLSFPRSGLTLALDFPNTGPQVFRLLTRLDEIVNEAGGAIYPAKDARMSPATFKRGYGEQLDRFVPHIDPRFSSGFWRRVMEQPCNEF